MPIMTMSGSHIFVNPGEMAFKIASNFTNYFLLGIEGSPDYWFEAKVSENEFLISGIFWTDTGSIVEMKDSFPKTTDLTRESLPNGYRIKDGAGLVVLGIEASNNICSISGRLHSKDGRLIAESSGDDFIVHSGPAVIGLSGNSRGIVIN